MLIGMLSTGKQIGPYVLIHKLGQGAFGIVWLAEWRTPITVTKVALKIPLDEQIDLDAIKQEANLWVLASGHPNILPIIEANVYDGQVVITSEYAPDGSLEGWLDLHNGGAPSVDDAVEIALGILAGLEHLHSRRIIHRDLKPANLLLQGQTPRLADFGISRVLKTTSQSMTIAGSPAYMAPEAFDGKRNEQTDIWSAGVILYQLLSGRLPFQEPDLTSLMAAILRREPAPLPPSVPNPVQKIVTRALRKDIAQRFKTATEMRIALRDALKTTSERNTAFAGTVRKQFPTPVILEPQPQAPDNNFIVRSEIRQPRKSKRPLFISILITAALVLVLAVYVIISFINKNNTGDRSLAVETVVPSTESERTLSYWISIRKDPRRYPGSKPIQLPEEIVFEKGDAIRLHFVSSQSGYLYIVNEGPTLNDGLMNYNLLFPSPTTNGGSAKINTNQELQIPQSWFVFDAQEGVEKIWLIWSAQAQAELEAVKKIWVNDLYKGEIKDAEIIKAVQELLTRRSPSNASLQKDEKKKQTRISIKGDALIHLLELEHH